MASGARRAWWLCSWASLGERVCGWKASSPSRSTSSKSNLRSILVRVGAFQVGSTGSSRTSSRAGGREPRTSTWGISPGRRRAGETTVGRARSARSRPRETRRSSCSLAAPRFPTGPTARSYETGGTTVRSPETSPSTMTLSHRARAPGWAAWSEAASAETSTTPWHASPRSPSAPSTRRASAGRPSPRGSRSPRWGRPWCTGPGWARCPVSGEVAWSAASSTASTRSLETRPPFDIPRSSVSPQSPPPHTSACRATPAPSSSTSRVAPWASSWPGPSPAM